MSFLDGLGNWSIKSRSGMFVADVGQHRSWRWRRTVTAFVATVATVAVMGVSTLPASAETTFLPSPEATLVTTAETPPPTPVPQAPAPTSPEATVPVAPATPLPDATASPADPNMVRLIVRTATAQDDTATESLVADVGGVQQHSLAALHAFVVEVPADELFGMALRYEALSGVTSVELDHTRTVASAAPSDPAYADQWALPKIGWDTAPVVTGAATIAVLDTGVDGANPDLAARLVPGVVSLHSC